MIAVIDYGVGNIFSLISSFGMIGQEVELTGDPDVIRAADRMVLPGVGAFADAARKLRETGLGPVVKEEAAAGKPLVGICLGMQLLFDRSLEFGEHEGLGLIPGTVAPISDVIRPGLKIPHIGWNALHFPAGKPENPVFKYVNEGDYVYFVHSYSATECGPFITATTDYGGEITAAVARDNVLGLQFHPEKSGKTGLSILKAFTEM